MGSPRRIEDFLFTNFLGMVAIERVRDLKKLWMFCYTILGYIGDFLTINFCP